jgi:CBS domain containing-hemolysin-like protein
MDLLLGVAALLLLIAANGWFVLGEFAYVAARRPQLEELAAAGDRRAIGALAVLRRLSFALSGAQLGITVTSLLVGFIAAPVFGGLLGPVLDLMGLPEERTAR